MRRLNSLWYFIRRHKYLFIIITIILSVGVLDDNSYLNRYERYKELEQLRAQISYYKEQYDLADERIRELETNPKAVEKLAREVYHMKRATEDVFVIIEEEDYDKVLIPHIH